MIDPCRSALQTIRDEMQHEADNFAERASQPDHEYDSNIAAFQALTRFATGLTALLAQLDGLPQQKEEEDPRVDGSRFASSPTGTTAPEE